MGIGFFVIFLIRNYYQIKNKTVFFLFKIYLLTKQKSKFMIGLQGNTVKGFTKIMPLFLLTGCMHHCR